VLIEKSDLEATNMFLQEQYDAMKIQKELAEKEQQMAMERMKQDLQWNNDTYKTQKEDTEDKL
jgi:hypothetical protein